MKKKEEYRSALSVQPGIEQPSQINPEVMRHIRSRRLPSLSTGQYMEGILSGNRTILSQAITLIESSRPDHQQQAQEILDECLRQLKVEGRGKRVEVEGRSEKEEIDSQDPASRIQDPASSIQHPSPSIRLGITGVPGVGKSTFIEALGRHVTGLGHKLAVLAVDPSSSRTKGSILGDKTRMESLANDPNAFIRPSPSAGSLGGVARKTRESVILCETAGFGVIFIETVGVGQSETAVNSMVDFFLLLMLAGAGDELQGIKRGIIEMADALIINKADGDNLQKARVAARDYASALHLFPPPENGWVPVVGTCSAKTHDGIDQVWQIIQEFIRKTTENGYFTRNRTDQNRQLFHQEIEERLRNRFYQDPTHRQLILEMENQVLTGKINPYQAVDKLMEACGLIEG